MYTRCPSCHSEISFEPPADMQSLPEGYKHRIKCPSCGVTIGVHLSKPVAVEPVSRPETQPVEGTSAVQTEQETAVETTAVKARGTGRNIILLIISVLFVGLSVLGYLVSKEVLKVTEDIQWMGSLTSFSGITNFDLLINETDLFKTMFTENIGYGIIELVIPMLLFVLSAVNAIVALISAIGGKYGRAYNVCSGWLIGGSAIVTLFAPWLSNYCLDKSLADEFPFVDYLKDLVKNDGLYGWMLAAAALGLLLIVLVMVFIVPLKERSVDVPVETSDETPVEEAE